jgi:membrane fusion protein (multidrug efflux system)
MLHLSHRLRNIHKQGRFWLIFILILIAVLGYWYYGEHNSAAPATLNMDVSIPVEAVTVQQQTMPISIKALGSLAADQQIEVSPEVDGQIAKINFHNGQDVKQGRLLFQIDDSVAHAQLTAAKAKLRLSKEDFRRNHRLLENDALSQQALDQAAEALAEDQAVVNERQLLVKKMQLRAPFDGTVGSRTVSVGQYVTVGQTLAPLVNTDSLKVIYNVSETYLPQLKLGQLVSVTSSALPGERFSGTVAFISPTVDVTSRTVEVHATVPNNAQQLAPGMFVNVEQQLGQRLNALVIPAEALVATISGSEVYVIQNGRAVETPVKVGARWGGNVEITSGLTAKQQIVNVGQQKLRDGSQVQIITATGDAA